MKYLNLLLIMGVYSLCYIGIKFGLPHSPPLLFGALRVTLGGIALLALMLATKSPWWPKYTPLKWMLLLGFVATAGPYRIIRHPQYAGFILVMFGFLLQWPTIITLVMFPILVVMYTRLALSEEAEVRAQFPSDYAIYAGSVPRFFPKLFSGGNKEAKAS